MSDRSDEERWLEIALAEFSALRAEILQRIQLQQVVLGLTITAVGTLLGVALAGPQSRAVLLLATPYLTSALGFAYFDHARRIEQAGSYVRKMLWPDFRLLSTERLHSWEDSFAIVVTGRSRFEAFLSGAYLVTVFVVSPVAANLYVAIEQHWRLPSGQWVLWSVGVMNIAVFCAFAWAVAQRYGRGSDDTGR